MPISRKCTLDGRSIHSLDELYDELAKHLPLPDHFGRNLDALWDVLSTDIEGPFEIAWQHADDSKKAMGKDYGRAMKLLRDLVKRRDDFTLIVKR